MTKALEMINICIFIVWEKGQLETGHFKVFQGRRDTLFSGKRDILSSGNDFFLWESDHLSSGIRDILWETGNGKRDTLYPFDLVHLSSGKYPLGIWEMRYNR